MGQGVSGVHGYIGECVGGWGGCFGRGCVVVVCDDGWGWCGGVVVAVMCTSVDSHID